MGAGHQEALSAPLVGAALSRECRDTGTPVVPSPPSPRGRERRRPARARRAAAVPAGAGSDGRGSCAGAGGDLPVPKAAGILENAWKW